MTYAQLKENARQIAIDWQLGFQDGSDMSYGELAAWGDYFHRLGRRYGLIREFRENAIPC